MLQTDKEIKYFWTTRCTTATFIFFANRFFAVLGAVSRIICNGFKETLERCFSSFWIGTISTWLTTVLIDYILLMRVVALYNQDRRLETWLKVILISQAAATLGVLVYYTYLENVTVRSLATGVTICGLSIRPPYELVIVWVLPIANGFLLLCLAVYKAVDIQKHTTFKGLQLVKVIVQGQAIYYCFFIAVGALRMGFLITNNPQTAIILFGIGSPELLCILGDQLLINLKEAACCDVNIQSNYWLSGASDDIELSQFS
ncbi:uncharacterized protein FOMMEDRAFT_171506 [Fomitiporia mediterranea MF3/22]|uniref:G-protein coupled receptors family 1 profile domain-containing protein n=1 Tax=Fomitiporia mediterranea (strain MF3/22) TaxID=694068 RepID=R7SJH2_FOMME|nr:uncharacterized protein FOMMEDRAFT_171506 [Fomitiporia mediterranea MF3/22]EJC97724.1 hypothetical protein FOMMEDRAFT_171506 [Fomitiporia mediterranea MF3/22]